MKVTRAYLGLDLSGHGGRDTVGPGGPVHGLEGLLHDGAVGDENENVLVPGEGVQAVEERLRQQIRVLVQPGQKRGLGTQGHVHVSGVRVGQMHLAGQSVASWEGDFVLDGHAGQADFGPDLVGDVLYIHINKSCDWQNKCSLS